MTAVVQIVDKVGTGGQVLVDLNRPVSGISLGRGHQFGEVEAAQRSGQQPFTWSAAPDEPVPLVSRSITVPVVLLAGTADAATSLARQVQQQVQQQFVLKVQRHGSSTPVWLRCAAGRIDWGSSLTGREDTTLLRGTLTAATEPYALGARVDVGPATITQDPASGTPFVWDITGVGGDALTPLVLYTSDTDLTSALDGTLISVRRRGTPSSLAGLWVQAEGATTTLGTSPPTLSTITGDADMSDGSALRATYGPSASGPWTLTRTLASLDGAQAPGTYRLLVRIRRGGAAAGALFSLVARVGSARLVGTVTAGGNDTRIVDLGLVGVPTGQPPYLAAPESPTEADAPTVAVTVVRAAAGGGTLDVDWLALVPADQDCGMLEVAQGQTGTIVLDGWDNTPRVLTAAPYAGGAQAITTGGVTWIGGAPRLRPGANRLWVVAGLGTDADTTRSIGLSLAVSGSYWPRYSWLA